MGMAEDISVGDVECGVDLWRTEGSSANHLVPFIGQPLCMDHQSRTHLDQHEFRVHNTTPIDSPYGTPPFNPYHPIRSRR